MKTKEQILEIISDYFNVSPEAIEAKGGDRDISKVRHIYWYFLRGIGYGSTIQGRMFKVDHASIIYGWGQVEKRSSLLANNKPADRIYFEQFNSLNEIIFGETIKERLNRETRELLNHVWEKRK